MNKILMLILFHCFVSIAVANTDAPTISEEERFGTLLDAHWQDQLKRNPSFATSLGVRDYDFELEDPSLEAHDAMVSQAKVFLRQLNKIDSKQLSESQQLNYQLLKLDLETQVEAAVFGGMYMLLTNRNGPHLTLTNLVGRLPFFTQADYQSYVARLRLMPAYLSKAEDRLRAGILKGWVQPCVPMQGYEQSIAVHLVDDAKESVFYGPFKKTPAGISSQNFSDIAMEAETIIKQDILPALADYQEFYLNDYASKCRAEVGTNTMPGGPAYYAHRVRMFTTTDVTPDEVHQLGLREVARIRSEMDEVIAKADFDGSFSDWLEYLKTNPDFYPKTAEERLQAVAVISKKIDGELPTLFGKLPRMPYGIKEIPADIAEKTTTAYYQRPAGDGSRAGFHFVNTSKLDTRPLYQLEALSLHEAVPGHHLQIALAQELDLPNFRKYGGHTVFIEGWALYAERLGLEVGFYQTPYTNFGRLSYEMWRACRLVVDTGLHSKGWSRQQAIDYMAANSGLSMNNIVSEVDRYITWPGQALAYKIGELKIRELRALAEQQLGEKFSVRDFHDKVLENGALPLSVLEALVKAWIKTKV